jgi:RHS repeat-associated protein
VLYFAVDGLGSTRLLTDTSANVANAFTYDAYGTLIASDGVPQTDFLFAGEQWDPHLRLYNNRARLLDPGVGRFLNRDTHEGNSEDPLSLHKYLYAHADPANRVDPSGQFALIDLMASMAQRLVIAAEYTYKGYMAYQRARATLDTLRLIHKAAEVGLSIYEKGLDGLDDEDIQAVTELGKEAFDIVAGRLLSKVGGANLGATITRNRELGNKLRNQVAAIFKRIGFEVELEVYKPTAFGPRFIDVEIRHRGKALGFEVLPI